MLFIYAFARKGVQQLRDVVQTADTARHRFPPRFLLAHNGNQGNQPGQGDFTRRK